jgi:hypothetical protein
MAGAYELFRYPFGDKDDDRGRVTAMIDTF